MAPAVRLTPELAAACVEAAGAAFGGRAELAIHRQCFLSDGHFAGPDEARLAAFLDIANDPAFDALWFARGGYGACRIAEAAVAGLAPPALEKAYLGYSDAGFLLAALDRAGATRVAHGPMAVDVMREGGAAAVARALAWLVDGEAEAIEPGVDPGRGALAFNLTVLSQLLGTPLEPDFTGRELIVEDVGEHLYRIDRHFFHVTSNRAVRRCAGLRLGRVSSVPANDPAFAGDEETIARDWCARSGIRYLGRADIGHDAANRIVPFRPFSGARPSPASP
jgi:muramoyltetrapeptide carboxypeptidase